MMHEGYKLQTQDTLNEKKYRTLFSPKYQSLHIVVLITNDQFFVSSAYDEMVT